MASFLRERGLTLSELITILAIISLLLWGGLPALRQLWLNHYLWMAQHRLHVSLNLARAHAVIAGVPVLVCAGDPDHGCAASGANWSDGWLVFEDRDGSGACAPGANGRCTHGGRILAVQASMRRLEVSANRNVARQVRFNALGMSRGHTGRFSFCHPAGDGYHRGLVVSNAGRVRAAGRDELLSCGGAGAP